MKLTIEAVYEKFIGRTDKFPEHFEDFTADIQAYVKQEMKSYLKWIKDNYDGFNCGWTCHDLEDVYYRELENYGKGGE
jgi:hypothetical protein